MDLIHMAEVRGEWRAAVNTLVAKLVPLKAGIS